MKKILASLVVVFAVFFTSCRKEQLPSTAPVTTPINVEYRVNSVSGHFTVSYLSPVNGQMSETKQNIDRTNYSVSFSSTTGTFLKIQAYNALPSADEVTVDIYVNGVLYQSGSANSPGGVADAEGKY